MFNHKDYLQLLDLMYQVAQSLEGKKHRDSRLHDCNKLALKLFFHAATLYWLRQGTKAPVPEPQGSFFYDMASAAVVTRSAFEAYLTMYEVFFEPISDDEREYRYALWFLSGFALREGIVRNDPTLVRMRERIKKTTKFASLKNTQKEKLLREGKIHAPEFTKRAMAAGFCPVTIKRMNRYLSSYVHSDGLSAVQTMGADTLEKQTSYVENCMFLMMMVMSKMILEYKKAFPSAEAWCMAKPKALLLAEEWAEIARRLE